MPSELPTIKDKMDTDSAAEIVAVGYPDNKSALEELIFWSCFPNDLVCWVTFPYISSLRDEVLAPAMAAFIEFHHSHGQTDLVSDVFWLFINERGEAFRSRILSYMEDRDSQAYFSLPEYSLDQYAEDRRNFDALRKSSAEDLADAEAIQTTGTNALAVEIKGEGDVVGAKNVVAAGYPGNEAVLGQLLFWTCFPDKPIYPVAFPYIHSLRDEWLAPAIATFIEDCFKKDQADLVATVFKQLIHERGEPFRGLIVSQMQNGKAKERFLSGDYWTG